MKSHGRVIMTADLGSTKIKPGEPGEEITPVLTTAIKVRKIGLS